MANWSKEAAPYSIKLLRSALHLLFLLLLLPTMPKAIGLGNKTSVEKNLIRKLLDRYHQFGVVGRPVETSEKLIVVHYGLALIQILDLDENMQVLRTNCWSRYVWNDSLLVWNPDNYSDIRQVRVFPNQLWTPDIRLYNFADERLKEHRNARVVVHSNGEILWIPQALFKSTCPVEITYFPFDTQVCKMDFGSWTYDITQLDIRWWDPKNDSPSPYIDFSDYVESNEWQTDGEMERHVPPKNRTHQVKSVRKMRRVSYRDPSGVMIHRDYPMLSYQLRLRRNPSFYVSILVIPCILLSCLTLVLFWLPPESPAKMMLGMNIFVAFFVLLLLLAETTPSAVKNFPLIGGYYCLNMILITLSTFLAVIVINLYFLGDKRGPVSPTIRRIMIDGLGKLLLVRQNIPLPELKILMGGSRHSLCSRRDPLDFARRHSAGRRFRYDKLSGDKVDPEDSPILGVQCRNSLELDLREIRSYVRSFVNRQKEKEARNLIAMEWRTVALILDRLFFCVYVLAISVAVVTLIPRNHQSYPTSLARGDNQP